MRSSISSSRYHTTVHRHPAMATTQPTQLILHPYSRTTRRRTRPHNLHHRWIPMAIHMPTTLAPTQPIHELRTVHPKYSSPTHPNTCSSSSSLPCHRVKCRFIRNSLLRMRHPMTMQTTISSSSSPPHSPYHRCSNRLPCPWYLPYNPVRFACARFSSARAINVSACSTTPASRACCPRTSTATWKSVRRHHRTSTPAHAKPYGSPSTTCPPRQRWRTRCRCRLA